MKKVEFPKLKVCIALPQHVIVALDKAADTFDGMSRSFLCAIILTGWLEAQGYDVAPNSPGRDELHRAANGRGREPIHLALAPPSPGGDISRGTRRREAL